MATYTIEDIWEYANIPKRNRSELELLPSGKSYYHIVNSATSSSKNYSIPINVPRRTLSTEDNTILRVCVADTVNDCLCAIGGHDDVYSWGINDTKYTIYAIDPELIIQPSKKLVADVEFTNEKWLINYDGKHEFFNFYKVGEIIGICSYYTKSPYLLDREEYGKAVSIYGLKVETKLQFKEDISLEPGYYKVTNTQTIKKGNVRSNFSGYAVKVSPETNTLKDDIKSYYAIERIDSYQELLKTLSSDNYNFPF